MSRKRKLALLFLCIILVVTIAGLLVRTVKASVWDGSSHLNIAVDNGDVIVWSIEPREKSAVRIVIPRSMYLSVTPYGSYRAAAVGKLSLLEKKDGLLVKEAIEESLAMPVDATIVRKDGVEDTLDLTDFFGGSFFLTIFTSPWQGRVTNLSGLDLARLWLFSLSLKEESIRSIDISTLPAVSKTTLPDGTQGLLVDREQSSKALASYLVDKGVAEEHNSVEVVNATSIVGAANELALLLTNMGVNVIAVTKGEKEESQTVVFARKKSYTAMRIAQIIGGKVVSEEPRGSRADIMVVLGEK